MSPDERFFYVHIMKTAGYSLVSMMKETVFDPAVVYPTDDDRGMGFAPYVSLDYLRQVMPLRGPRVRLFAGHFPFAAREILGDDVRTFSFFRDPVERVLSHLRYARFRNPEHRGWRLDRIYDALYEPFIHDLQTRTFAIASAEGLGSLFQPTHIDEAGYARAVENVERLDALGLVEDFAGSLRVLERRFGWRFAAPTRENESPRLPRGDHLRQRIARDNAMDVRFYEHVRRLHERRKAELGVT